MPETTKNLTIGEVVYRVFPGGGFSASPYWVDKIRHNEVRLVRPGLAIWVAPNEVAR
jgi:hypothetical protein